MIKKISTSLFTASILATSIVSSFSTLAEQSTISLAQVTKDITYLASDNLKGRGNFSTEIKQAASYIASRFQESGLIGTEDIATHSFLQKYKISKMSSTKLDLVLNGQAQVTDNLTIASTATDVSWLMTNGVKSNEFTIHTIGKDDSLREALSNINSQGGDHLVLLNPAHEKTFQRYQQRFARGVTKLVEKNNQQDIGGTIVIALSKVTSEEVKNIGLVAKNKKSISELSNVIAVLPGKTKPNEIVLYSAHYDHLGMTNSEGDHIFNGADDNASGTTAIINIAQHYAKQNDNARTLMFAAFSAEELGGFGSQYFSKQVDPNSITAMINIEMIGKPSKFGAGTMWMTGMERSNLGQQLNQVLAKSGNEIHQDPYPEQGLFYRSDNATLARLGVPAHSFSSTQLDKDKHYHNVTDDLSSLNLPSLHKVIEALAIATQPLVDGSVTPSRIDVNKVKNRGLIY
ncbi:M28 family peptidase [Colwellia sp. 6_MG-2023]|uniref:M28 family peptidase n=1 Tax=Colwellia sp. 6_MG-2023 TaxID=3062676 RepID=UPI0026E3B00C|nr:M28 family peptidase [Colwellia sp. 6_MG-2023]MDO6487642.1 M28 family peptidase [Colwellia sp. 6_MG-2023]